MNDFEIYLQDKLISLKQRRKNEQREELSENELIKLIFFEVCAGELFVIKRDFPDANVDLIIEKAIYLECRINDLSPEESLEETQRQMQERR